MTQEQWERGLDRATMDYENARERDAVGEPSDPATPEPDEPDEFMEEQAEEQTEHVGANTK